MATSIMTPPGAVLGYAGTYADKLVNCGWLLCDGTQLSTSGYAQLYSAIGTVNGGNGAVNFNIPDYRGVFLRGVDHVKIGEKATDPNSVSRTEAAPGGATGDRCGSFQSYATALPLNGLTASVSHIPDDHHHAYHAGVKFNVADWERRESVTVASSSGGDSESRPQNIYIDLIIQTYATACHDIPAGALVPMPLVGQPTNEWMLCDGRTLSASEYPDLFAAIQTCHGGTSSAFYLPDLRGRFVRGRAGENSRDPDAANRQQAASGGNSGNAVGSLQMDATGRPVNPFTTTVDHLPVDSDTAGKCAGNAETEWNPNAGAIGFSGPSTTGWTEQETRPVNLYADWYIKVKSSSSELPAGSIIAYAGDTDPNDQIQDKLKTWLLCDGKSYKAADYPALFAAIGTLNGGDGSNFNVPRFCGRFLRGVDHGTGRDPDANTRTEACSGGATGDSPGSIQGYATRSPVTAITGNADHLPTDAHHDTAKGALSGAHAAAYNSGSSTFDVKGGDKETRPVNIYVEFYIKCRK